MIGLEYDFNTILENITENEDYDYQSIDKPLLQVIDHVGYLYLENITIRH